MDPPTDRWPVFPTLDQRTLAELVQEELGGVVSVRSTTSLLTRPPEIWGPVIQIYYDSEEK
jgi:hypothetical protein